MDLSGLSKEFPKGDIHWRAQTLSKKGDKALALAYLDARDVMDRLDEVCGPENWQSRYTETPRGRVLCEIGIRIYEEWIWKSDGAGDTAVEGEKGGISDALKRAAVQWGIGRYLYRLESVWAPCETYQGNDGKPRFSRWIGNPWDSVRTPGKKNAGESPKANPESERNPDRITNSLIVIIDSCLTEQELDTAMEKEKFDAAWNWLLEHHPDHGARVMEASQKARAKLSEPTADEYLRAG